jgi:multiple sugar transport system substrate-binding protein
MRDHGSTEEISMTKASKTRIGKALIDRRTVIMTMGGFGTATVLSNVWRPARAQAKKRVRVWITQTAPDQMKAAAFYKESFEAKNPNVDIVWEPVKDDDAWAKLVAAFAGGDVPDLVQHLTPAHNASVYQLGKAVPMDDVVKAVGADDFFEGNKRYFTDDKGGFYGMAMCGTCFSTMWYRKDLFEKAGVKPPQDWAETIDVLKKTTADGIFGHPLTYGPGGMTTQVVWCMIGKSGGATTDANLNLTMNSREVWDALEYLKAIRAYAPPGANAYSYGESLGAFASGRTATGFYTGRALANIVAQNPAAAAHVSALPWPSKDRNQPWHLGGHFAQFIPVGAKNVDEAKAVAAWQYKPDVYVKFLHGAPGHLLPVLKSTLASPTFSDHPLLGKYKAEIKVMADSLAAGSERVRERPGHKLNLKMGEVLGSDVHAKMLQRVVIDNQTPQAAAAWAQDEIAKIMKS